MLRVHDIGSKVCHSEAQDTLLGTIISVPNDDGLVFVSMKDGSGVTQFFQEELETWYGEEAYEEESIFQVFHEEDDDLEELRGKLEQANEELRKLAWVRQVILNSGEAELGEEAEELRAGIEKIIDEESQYIRVGIGDSLLVESDMVPVSSLWSLLESVDARDCLARNR